MREKKKRTTTKEEQDAASPRVANSHGTSPERGRARENAAPNGPRTSLGDGVVKPAGARLDRAKRLRRNYLVDVLACACGGRRAIVVDISEREEIVALLAHLALPTEALPTEAPPIARARSPAFELG